MRQRFTRILSIALLALCSAAVSAAGQPVQAGALKPGILLVAKPDLSDKRFARTVILLAGYTPRGAWGVVLNKSSRVALSEVFPELPILEELTDELYLGGPVNPKKRFILVKDSHKPSPLAKSLGNGLYLSGSNALLTELAEEQPRRRPFRVIAGYAGWAPGQLDREFEKGDWIVQPLAAADVLETPVDKLWEKLVKQLPLQLVMR